MRISPMHVALLRERGFFELPVDGAWVDRQTSAARRGLWSLLASPQRDTFRWKDATELDDNGLFSHAGEVKSEQNVLERADGRKRYDSKFYFHYRPGTEHLLAPQGAPVAEYAGFFDACRSLTTAAQAIAIGLGHLIDEANAAEPDAARRYPGSFANRIMSAQTVTRLLRYTPQSGELPLANLHRDRNAVTVHWHSSHPGLVVYDRDRQPFEVSENDPGRAAVFLGQKAWGALRGTYGTGTPHAARNVRRAETSTEDDRFVAVSFVHCLLTAEDQQWMDEHREVLKLNPADYSLESGARKAA